MTPNTETLTFKTLRAASPDVLGLTKPVVMAKPSLNSNARGPLREIEDYEDVRKTASDSAVRFLAALASPDCE